MTEKQAQIMTLQEIRKRIRELELKPILSNDDERELEQLYIELAQADSMREDEWLFKKYMTKLISN